MADKFDGQGLFAGIKFVVDKETKEPITEGQMAQLMGNVMAQNVIVGRTNSSFHGLNNIQTSLYQKIKLDNVRYNPLNIIYF
jgi:hypothetical protein